MSCWFWNIDLGNQDYFADELDHGRLRQGWGYEPGLDLRKLSRKLAAGTRLSEAEQEAWDRCHPMLEYITEGDLVVVKNVPDRGHFTVVRVTGGYDYAIGEHKDFGHFLPIYVLQSFHKRARMVPAPFISALDREQNPIRITYKHDETVRELAASDTKPEDRDKPEEFREQLANWRASLASGLRDALRSAVTHRDAERLVQAMLTHDYGEVVWKWTAGPTEQGADFVGDVQLPYDLAGFKIAVQVKMHWGTDDDTSGIDQLEAALEAHSAQAGLLVTTADDIGDNLRARVKQVRRTKNIRVLYGEELYGRLLEVIARPAPELPEA